MKEELRNAILKNTNVVEINCIDITDKDGDRQEEGRFTSTSSSLTTAIRTKSTPPNKDRIEQLYVTLNDMSQYIPTLLTIIRREQQIHRDRCKILVFFPASRLVRFFYHFFTLGGINMLNDENSSSASKGRDSGSSYNNCVWEIHSRMSQSSRMRASNSFRAAKGGVLFSSDVSARGLDYPDVTLVVQLGAPNNDEQYIHRIGRTGRAGQIGKSLLVLLPFEGGRRTSPIKGENIRLDEELTIWINEDRAERAGDSYETPPVSSSSSPSSLFQKSRADVESTRLKVRSGHAVLTQGSEAAFKAFLAHYVATMTASTSSKSSKKKRSKTLQPEEVLEYAKEFAAAIGLANTPELDPTVASRMGLTKS
jgi:ATP-dependent RNA helicase MSS116